MAGAQANVYLHMGAKDSGGWHRLHRHPIQLRAPGCDNEATVFNRKRTVCGLHNRRQCACRVANTEAVQFFLQSGLSPIELRKVRGVPR